MKKRPHSVQQKSVLRFNFRILRIFGFWSDESNSNCINATQKIYKFIMISLYALHLLSQLIGLFLFAKDNILDALEWVYIPAVTTLLFTKIWYITKHDERIRVLINTMDEEIFKPRTAKQAESVRNHIKSMDMFFRLFVGMSVLTWTLFYGAHLKDIKQKVLSVLGVYPYQEDLFLVYYVYQSFEELVVAFNNVSVDCILMGFLSHMRMQLHLLNQNLRKIRTLSMEKLRKKNPYAYNRKELQDMMDETLVECIQHYEMILKMKTLFEETFGAAIFLVILCDCIVICMTMWQFILVTIRSVQFFIVLLCITCITIELLLFCWVGNELILKSSQIAFSAYASDWLDCSSYYRKNLLLFMTLMVQPIQVNAGYFLLSIQTFIFIMRAAWSYFTCLRQSFG